MRVRRATSAVLGAALAAGTFTMPATASAATAAGDTVDYHQWASPHAFANGTGHGVRRTGGGLAIAHPTGQRRYQGVRYDSASWTSPRYSPDVDATELVSSWNAHTPKGTWLQVRLRVTTTSGQTGGWYTMGDWAYGDSDINRTSVEDQSDRAGSISTDTFQAAHGAKVDSYRLQARLYRAAGSHATPRLSKLGAMASAVPDRFGVPASRPGPARGVELPVPRYSQDVHKGHYPQYGGGGEAWCSPTSTEMVTEYWGRRPSAADLRWIGRGHKDPSVDYAARQTYDAAYDGTGNWSFNAAYAAHYGLDAHITRLGSLNELERYVRRGIPVVTSQSFRESELPGAGYGTAGHLMVVIGFTRNGDVIANDPAGPDDAAVRHVYPRHAFENIWLRTKRHDTDGKLASGSGGVAYIIAPKGRSLP